MKKAISISSSRGEILHRRPGPTSFGGVPVAPERSVYFTHILLCCIWKGTRVNSKYMHLEVNNIHHEHYCLQENMYFWFRIKYHMSLTNWNLCVSNSHTFPLCEIIIRVVIFHSYLKSNWPSYLITEFILYFLKWRLFNIPSCWQFGLRGLFLENGVERHFHRKSNSEKCLTECGWLMYLEDARCIVTSLAEPKEKRDMWTPNTQRYYKCWVIAMFQHNPSPEWCHILWYILSWCLVLLYTTENMQAIRENISACACMCVWERERIQTSDL